MIRVLKISLLMIIISVSCKSKSDLLAYREDLIGDYFSVDKIYNYRLLLDKNEFKYWKEVGHSADFTMGDWKVENGNIILNSKVLSPEEGFTMSFSSGKWINFENTIFKIKNGKLIDSQNVKFKLKKN